MHHSVTAACALVLLLALSPTGHAQDPPAEGRPTFRSGAHYVRVDAYPTRDGRPVPGLTAEDFELLEDGKPQAIDAVEFIEHQPWTPLGERRDPNSQRDGFALARDARYRLFVLYLDAFHVDFSGSSRLRGPLVELLSRMMGPQDLFGVLTPAQSPEHLLLGQVTQGIEEQIDKHGDWGLAGRLNPQPGEAELEYTFPADGKRLVALRRLDKVYSDLEGLVGTLGALRDERKNIIYFSDTLPSPSFRSADMSSDPDPRARGNPPAIGVGREGQLTMGSRNDGDSDRLRMSAERTRLLSIDFDVRFRELLQRARQANVSFYTVRPGGLDVSSSMMNQGFSNLQVLAEQTDGIAVTDTNDLRQGLGQVAQDLSSHYVLGYYTNNTRWDGRPRKLTVRLKETGRTIRARREYRAPTEDEMAGIRSARSAASAAPAKASPVDAALSTLSRLRPSAGIHAYGALSGTDVVVVAELAGSEVEQGRWKNGGDVRLTLTPVEGEPTESEARLEPGARGVLLRVPVQGQTGPWKALVRLQGEAGTPDSDTTTIEAPAGPLLGGALGFRAASPAAAPWRPVAGFVFRRTERLRVQWPVGGPLDSQNARLLDRNGNALAIPLTAVTLEAAEGPAVAVDLRLAPLSAGDYLIELTAKDGEATDQSLVAIRVTMAR